ncbi:MAG: hypothetical protein PHU23_02630, partial [Dehalococcoidales bacterium]|nr:hypothetical protein [Dehalococcoidales bacterium]
MPRNVYLTDIPLEEAFQSFYSALEQDQSSGPLGGEKVPVTESLGRTTAGPVWARTSSPHYQAAAMDGIAVNAADTYGASRTSPVTLKIGVQTFWIDTGGPLPEGCNAVIMAEDVQTLRQDEVEIRAAA